MVPRVDLPGPGSPNPERSQPSPQRGRGDDHGLGVLDDDSPHLFVCKGDGRLGHLETWSIGRQGVHDILEVT
eukprot:6050753-Lingulodinium_polyedra.AAC.1